MEVKGDKNAVNTEVVRFEPVFKPKHIPYHEFIILEDASV